MVVSYPVIFTATHDSKDTYLAYISDFDGMTEGYGLEDAVHMARDYMGCSLYDKADNEIPKASTISDIDVTKGAFADNGESIVSLVEFDLDVFKRRMNKKVD